MQSEPRRHGEISSFGLDQLSRHWGLVVPPDGNCHGHDLHETFSQLLNRLHQYLRFDYLGIGLFNPACKSVSIVLQAGEYTFPSEFPVNENSMGLVVGQRRAIEVPDIANDGVFPDLSELCRPSPYRSFRVVPLATDRQTLGKLTVARKCVGAFSPEDVHQIEQVGALISLVLENTLMANVLGHEKAQLETLLEVNKALVSRLDLRKLLCEISGAMRRLIRNDFTHLALYEAEADAMKVLVLDSENLPVAPLCEERVPIDKCPSGVAFRKGQVTIFSSAELQALDSLHARKLLAAGIRSICYLPLVSQDRRLGVLGFPPPNRLLWPLITPPC